MADIVSASTPTEKTSLKKSGCLELSGWNSHGVNSTDPQRGCESQHTYSNTPVLRDADNAVDSGDENEEKVSGCGVCKQFSGRKKCTLILVALAMFLSNLVFSVIAPFYPKVAADKGMSSTTIGLVFGVFELFTFLTAPVFGNFLVTLGPKFVFLTGVFVAGSSNLLFGSLIYCPSGTPFIVLSLLIRSTTAVGVAAYGTAGFAIVSNEFKANIGTIIGILKSISGCGSILGPTIGGAFYELGGFSLPFYVIGITGLLNGLIVYRFLPTVETPHAKQRGSVLSLVRSPMVAVPMCSIFWGMVALTTYESTFSRHVEPLHLSVGTVGLIFGVAAFLNSAMGIVWGYISDSFDLQSPIIVVGHLIFAVGYLIVGPSFMLPFIPFSLVTIFIGLACIGLSLGATFIPTMKCMVIGAIELGFEDNVDTYGLVAGLFTSIQTLGGFIGPVGVGYLVDQFDFPVAYSVVALAHIFMMIVSFVFFALRRIKRQGHTTEKAERPLDLG